MRNSPLYLTFLNLNNNTLSVINNLKYCLDIKTNTKLILFIVDVIHFNHFIKTENFSELCDSHKFLTSSKFKINQIITNFNFKQVSVEINHFKDSNFEQQLIDLSTVINVKNKSILVELLLHNYLDYVKTLKVYY